MHRLIRRVAFLAAIAACVSPLAQAAEILYDQNFENPAAFVNDGGDVNIVNRVNQLYGGQPAGFSFRQAHTVETLLVTGSAAFGTGYSDPSGIAGNYTLGMLSSAENDLLGLSFNVGARNFFNVRMDISSIDLSVFGGPFVSPGAIPEFRFTLYDNPTGVNGLGTGAILDSIDATGTASAQSTFDWTEILLPLDARGNTNGNVTLRIDLLTGGYAAMDNFRIAASDDPGDVGDIPVPSVWSLLLLGVALLANHRFRRRERQRFA